MQFPTKQQCPKCYKSQPAISAHSNAISKPIEWDLDEIFTFLHSFYSKHLIVAINHTVSSSTSTSLSHLSTSNKLVNLIDANNKNDKKIENKSGRGKEEEQEQEQAYDLVQEDSVVEPDQFPSGKKSQQQSSTMIRPKFNYTFLVLFSFTLVALIFVYYNYIKRNSSFKLKKHIV